MTNDTSRANRAAADAGAHGVLTEPATLTIERLLLQAIEVQCLSWGRRMLR